jgi:hypothetical protein
MVENAGFNIKMLGKKVISAYPEVIQGTINRRKFRSQTSDNMDR